MTGPELTQIRLALGLTYQELAARLAVHWRTLYKWERGERKISPMVEKFIRKEIGLEI